MTFGAVETRHFGHGYYRVCKAGGGVWLGSIRREGKRWQCYNLDNEPMHRQFSTLRHAAWAFHRLTERPQNRAGGTS